MENQNNKITKNEFVKWSIEAAIRIGLLALIIIISFMILKPFIAPIAWGIIIAISLFPLAKKLNIYFGNRKSLTATILTVLILTLVIVPSIVFTGSIIDSIKNLSHSIENGELKLDLPENGEELSVAQQWIIEQWDDLSQNMEEILIKITPQLKRIGQFLLSSVTGLIGTVFLFIIAIIIAGVFLSNSEGGYNVALKLFKKFTGKRAVELLNLSVLTIRSVMQGVIGVAVIQAALVGIGFFFAGVPGAAVLTLIVMIMTIVQLPLIIIIIPFIFYVYTTATSGVAIAFTIWSILAALSDNVLKPMLLGRGMDLPMVVILIGAIGGMIASGLIGLFVGPVVLALGFQLFKAWMNEEEDVKTVESMDTTFKRG